MKILNVINLFIRLVFIAGLIPATWYSFLLWGAFYAGYGNVNDNTPFIVDLMVFYLFLSLVFATVLFPITLTLYLLLPLFPESFKELEKRHRILLLSLSGSLSISFTPLTLLLYFNTNG